MDRHRTTGGGDSAIMKTLRITVPVVEWSVYHIEVTDEVAAKLVAAAAAQMVAGTGGEIEEALQARATAPTSVEYSDTPDCLFIAVEEVEE